MFLEIKNLSKLYGTKKAVDDVSLSLDQGKILTILGPSGCGKTTLLRMIGGFLTPDRGTIKLDGQIQNDIPPEDRQLSTVFQSYGLFPKMTVEENIAYGLKFRNYSSDEKKEMTKKMIEKMRLDGEEKKHPANLSGGQRQRVALARSLIIRPKLLLLDEPLSNLDAKLRIQMRKEIKSVQQEFGVTMIFVTHDQEEAFSISDYMLLMKDGKTVQKGEPSEIYKNPANMSSLEFLGDSNINGGYYIRPEEIRLKDGGAKLKVINREFLGDLTIYILEDFEKNKIKACFLSSFDELEIGNTYEFELKWKEIPKK